MLDYQVIISSTIHVLSKIWLIENKEGMWEYFIFFLLLRKRVLKTFAKHLNNNDDYMLLRISYVPSA